MEGCYYVSIWGQAFAWTQIIPVVVSAILSLLSSFTSQIIYFVYGLYLFVAQYFLWEFQAYLQMERPNPICQQYHTFAFPSIETFYVASIVTFIVGYSIVWSVRHPWFTWVILFIGFFFAPVTLYILEYNTWYELLLSVAMGIVFTILFIALMYIYMQDTMPYILNIVPISWFGYVDTFICDKENQHNCAKVRKAIIAAARL